MPAEDRARKPGALPSAPEETGVSMSALLASRAAADAVSTPPSDADEQAEQLKRAKADGDEGSAAVTGSPEARPGRDAA